MLGARGLARSGAAAQGLVPSTAAVQQTRMLGSLALHHQDDKSVVLPKAGTGRAGVSGVVATVFGASGFLGRYVVNRLGRVGSQCVIPYRGDGMNVRHLKMMGDLGQIVPLPTSLQEKSDIQRAVEKSNVVINLVGAEFKTRNYSLHDANVKCSYRIAQVCKEVGVPRIIHVSALGADLNSKSEWMRTKAEGELAVRSFYPAATIMRPAPIFGDESLFLNRYADMAHFAMHVPLINGGFNRVQPVYVTDVAAAIMTAVGDTRSVGQTYELGGRETMTHKEMVDLICRAMYREGTLTPPVPPQIAKIYGTVSEYLPTRWRLMSPDKAEEMQLEIVVGAAAKRLEDLGVDPVGLSERIWRIMVRHKGTRGPARFTEYE